MVPLRFSGLKSIKFEFFLNFSPKIQLLFLALSQKARPGEKGKNGKHILSRGDGTSEWFDPMPPPLFYRQVM